MRVLRSALAGFSFGAARALYSMLGRSLLLFGLLALGAAPLVHRTISTEITRDSAVHCTHVALKG
jgi:predicted esterase